MDAPAGLPQREGEYGDRLITIEPGGVELIPLADRHGRPVHLFWTWASPNLEFATIFVGVLSVAAFGLGFWTAVAALALGTGLGAVSHGVLSARGPAHGVPQMVLGRPAFGFWGNALPAAVNTVSAGVGWFAVNSVSGAFALHSLAGGLPRELCLLIVVMVQVALGFFGHNLVQAFERYVFPVLMLVFAAAAVVILAKADPGTTGTGGTGGFLLTVGAAFGYAAGWNPYAADYTRYLAPSTSRRAVGLWSGLGLFVSCTALEVVGAASVTIVPGAPVLSDPTSAFTGHLPDGLAELTLLAIALGAISANAINVYSGALSFVALGIRLPLALRRAIVVLFCGGIGSLVAWSGLADAGHKYESFLLIIAYWIGPWLAVMLIDQYLRRGEDTGRLLFVPRHRNLAGPLAMTAGVVVSVWLFSHQERYVGVVAERFEQVGDITFEAGFLISALLYVGLRPLGGGRR